MSFSLLAWLSGWKLVQKLGGFAFIILGLLDSSVVPLPGSMDALTIVLSAARRDLWWYYALMATAGSVLGGYVTYRIARKGGKEAVEKKFKRKQAERAYRVFERWGFWSVFLGAIAPPPVPMVPFLATAGALQYPRHKFLTALTTGRLLRFTLVAWVAAHYGRHIFSFFGKYYKPALWTLVGLAVVGGVTGLLLYLRHRRRRREQAASALPDDELNRLRNTDFVTRVPLAEHPKQKRS
ncbi:MAG TPA: VTT domain-containing protein [Clostridia bacterium]|nr:VTT domain-containing protein [Clostridia bacterium]